MALDRREFLRVLPAACAGRLVHLVLVNGSFVGPEDRAARVLRAGDALAVWPPVAGG